MPVIIREVDDAEVMELAGFLPLVVVVALCVLALLVVAVVRPEKLNSVLEALYRAEVRGLTISRVQGHGGEVERVETYRGMTLKVELHDKVRLEIGVSDSFVEVTVGAILASARTGAAIASGSGTGRPSSICR